MWKNARARAAHIHSHVPGRGQAPALAINDGPALHSNLQRKPVRDTLFRYPVGMGIDEEREMKADKTDVLKRLNYIEGHLGGIRKMVEEDKYCVDILRQTYAVRKAIEKLETLILENHLASCVPEGIREGREEAVIAELVQLYNLAGNR